MRPHLHEWKPQGYDKHTTAALGRGEERRNAPAMQEQRCDCGKTRWVDVRVTFQ